MGKYSGREGLNVVLTLTHDRPRNVHLYTRAFMGGGQYSGYCSHLVTSPYKISYFASDEASSYFQKSAVGFAQSRSALGVPRSGEVPRAHYLIV